MSDSLGGAGTIFKSHRHILSLRRYALSEMLEVLSAVWFRQPVIGVSLPREVFQQRRTLGGKLKHERALKFILELERLFIK